jgi:hypothetical protein
MPWPSCPFRRHDQARGRVRRYDEEAARLKDRLRAVSSRISVTLDCWTWPNCKAFLGITGHYIDDDDDDRTARSFLLDFAPLTGQHTGQHLCDAFVATCSRFGMLHKLLGVTTDNASNVHKLVVCLEDACRKRGIVFDKEHDSST